MTGTDGGKQARQPGSNPGRNTLSGADMAGAGVMFGAVLVAFSLAGIWLDKQLGTSPWMLIVMVFAGAAAAFYSLYRKLMKGQRLGDRRHTTERRDES